MEEPINVRYTFMMLLAIADPKGYVIGTDIAIARRLNIKLSELQECLAVLLAPDPNSNSQESEGRRLVPSDTDRGYRLVNYLTYREMTSTENRRTYMREYMRAKRQAEKAPVKQIANNVKTVALLGQEEGEAEVKAEAQKQPASADDGFLDPIPEQPPKPNKARGSLQELKAFAVEIGLPETDGEAMFYQLEANGWKAGKTPLKCWRSHIRTYKAKGYHPSQQKKPYGTKTNLQRFKHSPANAGTYNAGQEWEY